MLLLLYGKLFSKNGLKEKRLFRNYSWFILFNRLWLNVRQMKKSDKAVYFSIIGNLASKNACLWVLSCSWCWAPFAVLHFKFFESCPGKKKTEMTPPVGLQVKMLRIEFLEISDSPMRWCNFSRFNLLENFAMLRMKPVVRPYDSSNGLC